MVEERWWNAAYRLKERLKATNNNGKYQHIMAHKIKQHKHTEGNSSNMQLNQFPFN